MDKDIIEEYYRENRNAMVKKLKRRCGSEEAAEDVVQDTFYSALKYMDSYDARYADMDKWFDRIAHNAFLKQLRADRKMGMTDELDEDSIEQPDMPLFEQQLIGDIQKELLKYSPHIAEVLDLFFFKQYAVKDIMQVTGQSFAMIDKNILRFKDALKAKYGQKDSAR